MRKIVKSLLISLIFGIYCQGVWAKNFRIEVIVFQQDSPTSERFDQSESHLKWPNTVRQEFRDNAILQKAYFSLKANNAYKLIWYKSWIQNVGSNQTSGAMPINKSLAGGDVLNGFIRLQRGHYLQLWVDLEFSPDGSYTDSPLIYQLKQKRRIKLNEIHYFDHPKFGVITTIRPL